MRTLFTRFYRREAISRCIGLVRRIKIIFLPTRCRGFGSPGNFPGTSVIRAPGRRQKRHGRLHRRCPPTPGNCDHNAPHSSCRACDRIAGYVSAPLRTYGSHDVFPGTSRTVVWLLGEKCENDHCWKESDGGRRRTWIRLEIDREAPPNGAFERSLGP